MQAIKQTVGLDIHKEFIYAVVLDNNGDLIFEDKIKTEPKYMDRFLKRIPKDSKIAMESCVCWEHIYDYIDDNGFTDIELANPSRIGLIAKSDKKTDKHDAKILADLARSNMLPKSYAPTKEIRNQRRITRFRASLGVIQGVIKNKIHAVLLRLGMHNPFNDLFSNEGIQFLKSIDLEWADRIQIDEYVLLIEMINKQKKDAEKTIYEYVETNPHAKLLCSMPGIATYSALTIMAEIGDIRRFNGSNQLVSFGGLNPRVSQSGMKSYTGRISKQGDKHLRWILNQCANVAVMHDSTLAKKYNHIKKKRGHNVAITAVARKMLIYIYTMLTNNIKYQQLQIHKKAS